MTTSYQHYLEPTFFLDFDREEVAEFADSICTAEMTPLQKGVALYYAVRDEIQYDPYDLQYSRTALKASTILEKGSGYCVAKAILLTALGRQQNIPCRLGFADVTNHLSTTKLREKMGTDLFTYHGYTEMYLNNKWVKATPAFNLSLCNRFNVRPLEFDGTKDSIFHEYDAKGQKHMEYMKDRGHYSELPFEQIFAAYKDTYPNFFQNSNHPGSPDFAKEAEQERN